MKDALREYGKTVAIFAAAGLVLSLLVGLLARNPFGIMLLRAVLFAIAFGGIGAGMQYVVRKFLPELTGGEASNAAPEAGEEAEKPRGSTIDITLPEEPPPAAGPPDAQAEVLEELPGSAEPVAAVPVEELDGEESGSEPAPAQRVTEPGGTRDGLDALADIGTMGAGGEARRSAPRFSGARSKPGDAARNVLEREDPASLARAVRTVLKREERS